MILILLNKQLRYGCSAFYDLDWGAHSWFSSEFGVESSASYSKYLDSESTVNNSSLHFHQSNVCNNATLEENKYYQ